MAFAERSGPVRDGSPDKFEAMAGRLAVVRFDSIATTWAPNTKQREKSMDFSRCSTRLAAHADWAVTRSRTAKPLRSASDRS